MAITKQIKDKVRKWENANLINYNGYVIKHRGSKSSIIDNMRRRGYDAIRISPGITNKYGLKYRVVYGASIEPNYRMS